MQEEDHTHPAVQLPVLMAFAYEVMIRYDVLSSHMRWMLGSMYDDD